MSSEILVYLVTFLAALITLFTAFGLGTILTPTLTFFYDIKIAVFLTAIVHGFNSLLRVILFRKHISLKVLRRFGILSIMGAFLGAFLQFYLYSSWLKIFLGILLLVLGGQELLPKGRTLTFPRKIDFAGGFFSGLLGGLIGNQGAIRSAYLLNYNLPKEAFIASAASIAFLVDLTRVPVYLISYSRQLGENWLSLLGLVVVAYLGTLTGSRLVKKVSAGAFKKIVALGIVILGVLLLLRII
jgi:uncharacterized membrane protein YfcA